MEEKDILKMMKLLDEKKDDPKVKILLHYLNFFDHACDFVLSKSELETLESNILNQMPLGQTFMLFEGFLSYLSTKYPGLLNEYRNSNRFKIIDNSKDNFGYGYASLNAEGKPTMVCGVHMDINDVYLLVHEFMHSLNSQGKGKKDRDALTEGFAIYSELLVLDYLNGLNIRPDEIHEFIKIRLKSYYERSTKLKEIIKIIKYIYTNPDVVSKLKEKANDVLLSEDDERNLLSNIQYTFGNITSFILYGRREDGTLKDEDYARMNEEINTSEGFKVFAELFPKGLNLDEFINGFNKVYSSIDKEALKK